MMTTNKKSILSIIALSLIIAGLIVGALIGDSPETTIMAPSFPHIG